MSGERQSSPMCRLIERNVRSGLVMAWRLATSPTSTSPDLEKATTDGVVRLPSVLGMTTGSPASRKETTEFVVPRSIPTALGMGKSLLERCFRTNASPASGHYQLRDAENLSRFHSTCGRWPDP